MRTVAILFALLLAAPALSAQTLVEAPEGYSESFSIHGSLTSYSELYAISGAPQRRPGATQRFLGNASINLFGIKTGLSLVYSTEQNRIQQTINQLGLNGQYEWIRFGAGTIFPSYSPLMMSGQQVLGGELELSPGGIVFGAFYGQNLRPVEGDSAAARPAVFDRRFLGARIGVGAQGQSDYLHLSALWANDDTTSVQNRFGGRPEQNVVAGLSGGLALFDRILTLKSEVNASALTRNKFATALTSNDIPGWVQDAFGPNLSLSVGYAASGEMLFATQPFTLSSGYRYVSAAYTSLGVAGLINDLQEWRLAPTVRLMDSRLSLAATLSSANNNVSASRLADVERTNVSGSVSLMASQGVMISAAGSYFLNTSTPRIDTLRDIERRTAVMNVGLTPVFTYSLFNLQHNTAVSASFQSVSSSSGGTDSLQKYGSVTENISAVVSHSVVLPGSAVVSLSAGGNFATDITSFFAALSGSLPLAEGLFSLSGSANANLVDGTFASSTVVGGSLSASWRPLERHVVTLTARTNYVTGGVYDFMENTASLQYSLSL